MSACRVPDPRLSHVTRSLQSAQQPREGDVVNLPVLQMGKLNSGCCLACPRSLGSASEPELDARFLCLQSLSSQLVCRIGGQSVYRMGRNEEESYSLLLPPLLSSFKAPFPTLNSILGGSHSCPVTCSS